MNINEIIRALREDNDLTQTELGRILNVNQITISQYERGIRQLSPNMIIAYAKFFNVSTDYILGLTDEQKPLYKAKNIVNINTNNGKITMK